MKLTAGAIACFAVMLSAAPAQTTTESKIQPTPLESFAKQPGSHVAWSEETGRIESTQAHAVITALVVEDTAQPADRLRGIRIDLSDDNAKDQVYLGEETLTQFRDALEEISHSGYTCAEPCPPNRFFGAALFWYGDKHPSVHTLTAAHYYQPGSSGMMLRAIGAPAFFFPDQNESRLSEAIVLAIEHLKGR